MENASKALLMAGGVLLVMLVVALLVYQWSTFSEYQTKKNDLMAIDDLAKFNTQFTNYDRDDIKGYELLSLSNQVADYNNRISTEGRNDKNYSPITLVISFQEKEAEKKMQFARSNVNGEDDLSLFTMPSYTQSSTINTIETLFKDATASETHFGKPEKATKITKLANSIFLSDEQLDNLAKKDRTTVEIEKNKIIKTYNSLSGFNINSWAALLAEEKYICKYWEYMQFKKAEFKCTGVEYNEQTGRVSKMSFEWTGKIY